MPSANGSANQTMLVHAVKTAACFAVAKGMALAVILASLDIEFWKSVAIAAVSGIIGFAGAITAAIIASRATRENATMLRDIQRKTDAARRRSDDA